MTKQFIVQDPYFKKAKEMGYRARSAFKLLEIQEKYHIIDSGMCVLDVGCAPGSFMQVVSRLVGPPGRVIWVDIQSIKSFGQPNISFLKASIFDYEVVYEFIRARGIEQFDLIVSDIAPNTSWITWVDQYRSIELNLAILEVADEFLKPGGNTLLKVFIGEDVNDLIGPIKEKYQKLVRMKPQACRDRSFEEYFICMGKK